MYLYSLILYRIHLYVYSVIAAVRNEHSVDELSTPYKRILLNQIQQHLTSTVSLPATPHTAASSASAPAVNSFTTAASADHTATSAADSATDLTDSEESLAHSFDSSHRKKARPCKYVANGDDVLSTPPVVGGVTTADTTSSSPAALRSEASLSAGSPVPSAGSEEEDDSTHPDVDMREQHGEPQGRQHAGGVDDVISAISARAEYKQQLAAGGGGGGGNQPSPTAAAVKGSAIAQVISGLLGANKAANSAAGPAAAAAGINTPHRQSIST